MLIELNHEFGRGGPGEPPGLAADEVARTFAEAPVKRGVLESLRERPVPIPELLGQLGATPAVSPFEVLRAVADLESTGLVRVSDVHPRPKAERPRRAVRIAVRSLAEDPGEVGRCLGEMAGIELVETGPDLLLVFADDYLDGRLAEINRAGRASGLPWMLVGLREWEPRIGPIFVPGESACWACLRQRLQLHADRNRDRRVERPVLTPFQARMLAFLLRDCVAEWWTHFPATHAAGKLKSVDLRDWHIHAHTVAKRPQCPTCGDPAHSTAPARAIRLDPKIDQRTVAEAPYRTAGLTETYHRYRHHVSPITGIAPYLKVYHASAFAIHNFTSGRNLALHSRTQFWRNLHLRSSNGGKGKTARQAQVGAIAEAIERYCLVYPGDTPTVTASLRELPDALSPNSCMGFSPAQFRDRDRINAQAHAFYSLIPLPFAETETMEWTPVWSLTEEKFKYLPTCFCYAQYPAADETRL